MKSFSSTEEIPSGLTCTDFHKESCLSLIGLTLKASQDTRPAVQWLIITGVWNTRPQSPTKIGLPAIKTPADSVCSSSLLLSYLLNVTAITQPVISLIVMMQGMQPAARGAGALTMWDCRLSRAHPEADTLRSCRLWVSVIMHWADWEQGMLLVLKEGGSTTLLSLISAIVPYLKHDIKPGCQSKPKQIWLEELQKTADLRVCPALKHEAPGWAWRYHL